MSHTRASFCVSLALLQPEWLPRFPRVQESRAALPVRDLHTPVSRELAQLRPSRRHCGAHLEHRASPRQPPPPPPPPPPFQHLRTATVSAHASCRPLFSLPRRVQRAALTEMRARAYGMVRPTGRARRGPGQLSAAIAWRRRLWSPPDPAPSRSPPCPAVREGRLPESAHFHQPERLHTGCIWHGKTRGGLLSQVS